MADTNINNGDNLNLSEMEKIFVPKDLDSDGDRRDYAEYSTMLFKPVPKNCVLVKKNRFTGNIKVAGKKPIRLWIPFIKKTITISRKTTGLKMANPILTKGMLVSTVDRTIDFDKIDYLTKDGIMVNVDIATIVNITDAKKYMEKGKEQLVQLDILIKKLLRIYIASRDFEGLSKGECQLRDFDHTGELIDFENKYGIKISKIIFKEVRLPERLQKLYNDRAEATQKRNAQEVQLEAAKEKARAEAEIKKIEAEAEAKRIQIIEKAKAEAWTAQMRTFVQYLEEKGLLTEKVSELLTEQLKLKTITDNNANAIFSFGDNNSQAANIAAGIRASNNTQTNSRIPINISNSEQLLNDLRFCLEQGTITEDRYNAVIKLLMNPEQKKIIDMASKEMYNKWFLEKVLEASPTNSESQTTGTPHPRR